MPIEMKVKVLHEAGYDEALYGLSLNKNQPIENMPALLQKLSTHDGGHNKALEHIMVWLSVSTTRFMWSEMDTYRMASKNSESTMHTICKTIANDIERINDLFEVPLLGDVRGVLIHHAISGDLLALKQVLPESFIQKRMWMVSYKCLRNIILQRRNHRLPHWKMFCESVLDQVEHPELLPTVG